MLMLVKNMETGASRPKAGVSRDGSRFLLACVASCAFLCAAPASALAQLTWSAPSAIETGALTSVACVAAIQCTAVDGGGREVTFNPQSPGSHTPVTLDRGSQGFYGVACPSVSQCTAVGRAGREVTFNPQSPGTPTSVVIDSGSNYPTSLACVSVKQCTAVDSVGREVTFNPQSPGTAAPVTIDSANSNMLAVACPSATQCTTVEYSSGLGREVTFNPQSPGTPTPVTIDSNHDLTSVTCPSVTQCVAADTTTSGVTGGRVVTFNPQAPTAGTPVTIDSDTGAWIYEVACASANDCVAVDNLGNVGEGDPTSASAWKLQQIDGVNSLAAVTCPVAALCVAVDGLGNAFVGRNLSLPLPPAQTGSGPSISGTTTQGQTLTESPGSWSNSPTGYADQWQDCDPLGNSCTPIAGATSESHTLTAADVGHTIRVQEIASNAGGQSSPAVSPATPVVRAAPPRSGSSTRLLGRVTTSASGATVTLGCSGSTGASCHVKLTLTATETLHDGKLLAVSAKASDTKKSVVLGRAMVRIAAGKIKRVTIRLDKAGKRLLTKRHKLRGKLTITAGPGTVATKIVTFRRSPNPKHHG